MENDHCAICFSESDLQKCNKCTALYCKKCNEIIKTKFSNVCSVCQQPCDCVKESRQSITKVHPEPPPQRMYMNRLFTRIDNFFHSPQQQIEPCCSFCCRPNPDTTLDNFEFECLCRCCFCCHCWYWRCCFNNTWVQNVYLTLTTTAIIGPAVTLIVCFA